MEVLQLISEGRTNREVAGALVISVKTVGRHIVVELTLATGMRRIVSRMLYDLEGAASGHRGESKQNSRS